MGTFRVITHIKRLWESISLNFMSNLRGETWIDTHDNRLISKYATFFVAPLYCLTNEVAKLIMKNVIRYYGVSQNIISDHNMFHLNSQDLSYTSTLSLHL